MPAPFLLSIQNHGPLVIASNYWSSPQADAGQFFLSMNGGAFRLLVPKCREVLIPEFTASRGVAVSRGPFPALSCDDMFDVLFDDGSAAPFGIQLSTLSVDRLPTVDNVGRDWVFSAWTNRRPGGNPRCVVERPCRYRLSASLPDPRPWDVS